MSFAQESSWNGRNTCHNVRAGSLRNGLRVAAKLAALLLSSWCAQPAWPASLAAYGRLPTLEDVAISPDGTRIAYVRTEGNTRLLVVVPLNDRSAAAGLRLGDSKLRSISWADDEHIMIITSATALPPGFAGTQREWFMLQVYNLKKKRTVIVPDPRGLPELRMMNVVSGRIMVRHIDGDTVLFVPGIYGRDLPALFRVDLQTGREKLLRPGAASTRAWLVNGAGELTAEEDYFESNQRWTVKVLRHGRLQEIASGHESIEVPKLLGFGSNPDTLLMQSFENGDGVWRLLFIKDGSFGPPMPEHALLSAPIVDGQSDTLIGGIYIDDDVRYQFFEPAMQLRWESILAAFPGERVRLASSSADFAKVIVRVDGPRDGFVYDLVDLTSHHAMRLGAIYDGVKESYEVRRITYAAADGLQIPAYLTLPRAPARNLPLIVLPHGGPAARDTAEFDWWSQALADQGYAVLRPNYRGSSLDWSFTTRGFGEWGRKMQTDLSDGVRYLAAQGTVDPARVCIVGASYGGYAALAGVTLDPAVYRCAVAVAGISDLKRFLQWTAERRTRDDPRTERYWSRFMGIAGPEDPVLDQISPIKHLDAVRVPVLLIHGRDDTVVPFEQSNLMLESLRHAGKEVELVALTHEDHWLSLGETRLQMLESTVAFLRAHNPPG